MSFLTPLYLWKLFHTPSKKDSHQQTNQYNVIYGDESTRIQCQGTIGCTPNSVTKVFIVFSRDSWGF